MKRTLFQSWLSGALLLVLPAAVQAQFSYTTINGAITITGYTGSDGAVTIPGTIAGLPVTSIGDSAFDSDTFTNVSIPNGVTNIGPFAFHFTSLTSVAIPGSVTFIGYKAFATCGSLISVTIPEGVSYIDSEAFSLDLSLTGITIPNSVINLGEGAFLDCINMASVSIGHGVKNLSDSVFSDCSSLTNVIIPTNVVSIGFNTFFDCGQLVSVTIPNSVTSVGGGAFGECTSLPGITIPNSVTNIGPGAFLGPGSLAAITVDAANPAYASVGGVLLDKNQTTIIEYPNGVSGNYTIPANIRSIGESAFEGCAELTGVTIPNSVTNIGIGGFSDCTLLAGITIPHSITSIQDNTFTLSSLTNITIPDSVTNIGEQAFYQCNNLTGVYFQSNAPALDGYQMFFFVPGIAYYQAGSTGWGATYGGLPTVMLNAQGHTPSISGAGVKTNGFGFSFAGVSNQLIVVQTSTNLTNWQPIQTNTLGNTAVNLADTQWNNYPRRFYRVVLAQPQVVAATYIWTTNGDGTVTITGYLGSGGQITLPAMIAGRRVTGIAHRAFFSKANLIAVAIPSSITNIGTEAFALDSNLSQFSLNAANPAYCSVGRVLCDKGKTNLLSFPDGTLGSYTVPGGVTRIGTAAFEAAELNAVTIPGSVTSLGDLAFCACGNLQGIYFQGNAPALEGGSVFLNHAPGATVHYQAGTTGWGATYGGLPTTTAP